QRGIVSVYDTHRYESERREAAEKWSRRIAEIVSREQRDKAKANPLTMARLKRHRPDLVKRVEAEELTVAQAAAEAGFGKPNVEELCLVRGDEALTEARPENTSSVSQLSKEPSRSAGPDSVRRA